MNITLFIISLFILVIYILLQLSENYKEYKFKEEVIKKLNSINNKIKEKEENE